MHLGKVSVVVPAHNEGQNLADTVACITANTRYPDYEVVVVDDGSDDGSPDQVAVRFRSDDRVSLVRGQDLGIPKARNMGAAAATGDIVIFLDGHCYVRPGWMAALVQPLNDAQVGMVGPAFANINDGTNSRAMGVCWHDASLASQWMAIQSELPYPVAMLPGGCQVVRRAEFDTIGGFDAGLTKWGSEDQELSLNYWFRGYDVVGQPAVTVYHLFRQSSPHDVQWEDVVYNRLRLALCYLNDDRAARVIDYHRGLSGFGSILLRLMASDTLDRRRDLQEQFVRDDDWFWQRFQVPF